MINFNEAISIEEFLLKKGINYNLFDDNQKKMLLKHANIKDMSSALDFLVNHLGVSINKIENCPSILYLNPKVIENNYKLLIEKGIDREKIIGCLHVLSSNTEVLKETYDYISMNYGIETFNKNVSILVIPIRRIKEIEQKFTDRLSKSAILSVALTTLKVAEINIILDICEKQSVEVTGSFFQKGIGEIGKIIRICQENNIEISGSVFRKSSSEVLEIIKVCNKKNVEITGNVFLKDADEVSKIIDICRKYGINITGSVFRRDADEIDGIVEVCREYKIPVSGTVFLRTANEIRRIYDVCKKHNIQISPNVFKKSADQIEEIVEVCEKYNVEVNATMFSKNASSLDNSDLHYIEENYGRSYLTPLIVVTGVNHLKKVFPYLDAKGTFPNVVISPAILTLKFDEIVEREKVISQLGEEDVVNGRFNPIYGLSKKKYTEKLNSLVINKGVSGK